MNRRTIATLVATTLLALAALLAPVSAQPAAGKKALAAAESFAAHNSLFVLYHEVGHLIIDQLRLPILGREEDAADNIATWIMLNEASDDAHRALEDAAYGWMLSGIAYGSVLDDSDYQAGHTLDRQRAFQIVCLMVGSDEASFRTIANRYAIDYGRQQSCYWDHDLVDRSMRELLVSHVNLKSVSGGIKVTYHDVSGQLEPAASAFRDSGVFERVAESLETAFPMTREIEFNAKRCGEANAFYDPNTVEIIFCYELMEDFMNLATEDMRQKGTLELGPGTN